MSNAVARLAIAMLVALVIPVHATAGAVADLCMVLGHHGGGAAAEHDATAHSHQSDGRGGSQVDGHDGGACASCAACCGTAAISGLQVRPIEPFGSYPPTSKLPSGLSGLLPERLDRPPLAL
jgi:hypothetical protein